MRIVLAVVAIVILSTQVFCSSSPESQSIWDFQIQPVESEIISSYRTGSIQVNEVYYYSKDYNGQPARIFGYYCYPADRKDKLPTILISHGGGGTAVLSGTLLWARRGYAVLSIDLPGQGEQRAGSRSTGPDMTVPNLLHTQPDPENNYLVHAVAAIRNGITFLTQQKQVDSDRIAMVGLSWGGVLTLLTNGQDDRLATAVNVFGAGFIPEGCTWQTRFDNMSELEKSTWDNLIDPKNFLATQHAPILFITGTNDHCYYLPTFQKSYQQVTVPKKMYIVPNLRHQFLEDTQQVVFLWLDDKLKYNGSFPRIELVSLFQKSEDKLVVSVQVEALHNVTDATLYYTIGGPSRWTKRVWQSQPPYVENEVYYFAIPTEMVEPEMLFFVNVEDDHGRLVSSPVRSIMRVNTLKDKETFAVSSPIENINIHQPPLKFLGSQALYESMNIFFSKSMNSYHLMEARNLFSPPNKASVKY
ncbi:MAG: alpha/beta fold hydrolase [bacterium]